MGIMLEKQADWPEKGTMSIKLWTTVMQKDHTCLVKERHPMKGKNQQEKEEVVKT